MPPAGPPSARCDPLSVFSAPLLLPVLLLLLLVVLFLFGMLLLSLLLLGASCHVARRASQLSDPDLLTEADKHYFLRRGRDDETEPTNFDYDSALPLALDHDQVGKT